MTAWPSLSYLSESYLLIRRVDIETFIIIKEDDFGNFLIRLRIGYFFPF